MEKNQTKELAGEFKTIRRFKVYEEISRQIEKLIHNGKLKPGDKLPTERELSELFGVSRHSVREAIRVLEKSRLLNSVAGSGTYVAMNENQKAVNEIATYLLDKTDKLAEIFQLRRIIEPQVAGLAAQNATGDNIKELELLLKQIQDLVRKSTTDRHEFSKLDIQLHKTIAIATQNSIIVKIIERLNDLFHETRQEGYQSETRMKISSNGHVQIIQAILERDALKASAAMDKHLRDVENAAIEHIVSKSLNQAK